MAAKDKEYIKGYKVWLLLITYHMKFCPECGSRLPIGIVESCSSCGMSLWANITSETNIAEEQQPAEYTPLQQIPSSFDEREKEDEIKGEFQNQTIYSLAIKIQQTIEQILKNMEYSTETETKLVGNGYATQVPTVEYKDYHKVRLVEVKEPLVSLISINLSPDPKLNANILGLIDISL